MKKQKKVKYWALARWFNTTNPSKMFEIFNITTSNKDKAWEEIEETIADSNNSIWLLDKLQLNALSNTIKKR